MEIANFDFTQYIHLNVWNKKYSEKKVNLSFDWMLKTPSFDGGGVELPPPPTILFVKTIEKLISVFLSGSFEDMSIFHVFI